MYCDKDKALQVQLFSKSQETSKNIYNTHLFVGDERLAIWSSYAEELSRMLVNVKAQIFRNDNGILPLL